MAIGKRLLVFSHRDPKAASLTASVTEWGCLVTAADTLEDLRARLEGSDYDLVLVEDSRQLRRLVSEVDPNQELLNSPLAEIEKRHILRVLHHHGGNKTRAAKVLGIDTKTLYNKLKAYGASAEAARRRQAQQQGLGQAT